MAIAESSRNFPREPGPTVYGYVRHDQADEVLIAFQKKEIQQFCRARSIQLQEIFVDRHTGGNDAGRTSFIRLVDALSIGNSLGVVLPDLNHLSPNEVVRLRLLDQIVPTGADVIVIPDDPDFRVDGA
ncbi:recombinase family protein [Umezawaea endophytica]|uniref:Recombinase family protein n=1 Tax=Umezawaea endophytica TaxID=1654476 RepID=A0A9X3AD95_9PSEU|nr:recombinase family protein [Umezawaea endophytica]MCS7475922.1 recombinase family protein [Umezawaea endophytica]